MFLVLRKSLLLIQIGSKDAHLRLPRTFPFEVIDESYFSSPADSKLKLLRQIERRVTSPLRNDPVMADRAVSSNESTPYGIRCGSTSVAAKRTAVLLLA